MRVVDEKINPLHYGAVGNGSTLDDAAFEAMRAAAPSARQSHIYIPGRYRFRLSAAVALPIDVHLEGPDTGTDSIVNDVSDVFTSGTLSRAHIHDLGVTASAGHIFNFAHCSQGHFHDIYGVQMATDKSVFNIPSMLDMVIEFWLTSALGRTVPLLNFVGLSGNMNDNTIARGRIKDNALARTWAMHVRCHR